MPVVGDPPGMAPIAGFGAVQCLSSAAHENLGAHDRHLGKNEKMNFGPPAMQICDSAVTNLRETKRVRHLFGEGDQTLIRSFPRKRESRAMRWGFRGALGPRFRGDER
jgi:hypothetical protein